MGAGTHSSKSFQPPSVLRSSIRFRLSSPSNGLDAGVCSHDTPLLLHSWSPPPTGRGPPPASTFLFPPPPPPCPPSSVELSPSPAPKLSNMPLMLCMPLVGAELVSAG